MSSILLLSGAQLVDAGGHTIIDLTQANAIDATLRNAAGQLGVNLANANTWTAAQVLQGANLTLQSPQSGAAQGAPALFLRGWTGAATTGVLLTGDSLGAFFLQDVAGVNTNLYVDNVGNARSRGGILAGGNPPATAGYTGIGTTTGVGNGAAAGLQSPAKGTGSGPVSLTAVTWLQITQGVNTYWVPLFQ